MVSWVGHPIGRYRTSLIRTQHCRRILCSVTRVNYYSKTLPDEGIDMKNATPTKLRNGDWGAKVHGAVESGDTIQIRTKSGKEWTARVERVLWTDNTVSIVATANRPQVGRSRGRGNRECSCGWGDDLLSFGYSPGWRGRCPDCGGLAEAV